MTVRIVPMTTRYPDGREVESVCIERTGADTCDGCAGEGPCHGPLCPSCSCCSWSCLCGDGNGAP